MSEPIVSIVNVEKFYGNNKVVNNLNMNIEEGEFLTMLGPSGCGKTTTLRMIAGFEDATSGIIKVENERVENKEPYERNVNTVFQNYALFPHMTVYENIAYGLNIKKVPKDEVKQRVKEMLELVQLKGFEKRKPDQMSGGQKQRVAIARALVNRPRVLLLDEPLGALDLKLRKQMQVELKRLQRKLKTTFIYVTHDQEEALTMSDRIAIMNGGNLEQIGTPDEIYEKPKTKFVAGFIGESNILEGVVTKIENGRLSIGAECGNIETYDDGFSVNETLYVSVRPENMKYSKIPIEGFSLVGSVKDHIYVGALIKTIVVLSNGDEIKFSRFPNEEVLKENEVVYLYWDENSGVPIKREDDKLSWFIRENAKGGNHMKRGRAIVQTIEVKKSKKKIKSKVAPIISMVGPIAFWLSVFVIIPLIYVAFMSFMKRGTYGGISYEFTLSNYKTIFDPLYFKVITNSIKIALTSSIICILIGYPFAYFLSSQPPARRGIFIMLIMIPFWTSSLVRTYSWVILLHASGILNSFLLSIGVNRCTTSATI